MQKLPKKTYDWQKDVLYIIGLAFAIGTTWGIINQMSQIQKFQQIVAQTKAETRLLEQQIKNQKIDNEFLQSPYYIELALREKKGVIQEGEKVVIINNKTITDLKQKYQAQKQPDIQTSNETELQKNKSNLQKWWDFIFALPTS